MQTINPQENNPFRIPKLDKKIRVIQTRVVIMTN